MEKLKEKALARSIALNKKLSKEEQLLLFEHSDAINLLKTYVNRYSLCTEAELNLLNPPYFPEVLEIYIKNFALGEEAETKLLKLFWQHPIILSYIKRHQFSNTVENLMFELPCAAELVLLFVKHGNWLSSENELKMLTLPNAREILAEYDKNYYLSPKALELAKEKGYIALA